MGFHSIAQVSLEVAIFLLFSAALAASVLGGVIRGWSILSRLYSLEDRVAVVEGTLLREVKTRAGLERGKNLARNVHEIDPKILEQKPAVTQPWWTNPQGIPRAYDGK
jgi:hypothetical protein